MELKNSHESEVTSEVKGETPEFKAQPQSNETAKMLAEDYKKAEALASETLNQIHKMGEAELIKGKIESMPKTDSEKRLKENVGVNMEELEAKKAEFAGLSNAEMYNKFQTLTLEKTKAFLVAAGQELKPSEKGELNLVLKKINSTLEAIELGQKNGKGSAIKGYAEVMKENVNKKADGYMAFDNLSKVYKKAGYESSLFNGSKVYESFQNDLAEGVLTKDQQEAFAKMQKEATKNSGNTAASFAAGGMSQKMQIEPIFSSKTTEELGQKYKKAA